MSFRLPTEQAGNAQKPANENALGDSAPSWETETAPQSKAKDETNRAYYQQREAVERLAAKRSSEATRSAHEELARRYAALSNPDSESPGS
jgi:hypothetical protein